MFGALNVSTSGLIAQRTRMEVITANLINRDSQLDAQGNYAPYRRRVPVFAVGDPATGSHSGVHVQEIALDTSPLRKAFEPGNPLADAQGYVEYPNVDLATEMINAIDASRAYEANITAAEATKSMMLSSLRLLA